MPSYFTTPLFSIQEVADQSLFQDPQVRRGKSTTSTATAQLTTLISHLQTSELRYDAELKQLLHILAAFDPRYDSYFDGSSEDLNSFLQKTRSDKNNELTSLVKKLFQKHSDLRSLDSRNVESFLSKFSKWALDVLPLYNQYLESYRLDLGESQSEIRLRRSPMVRLEQLGKFLQSSLKPVYAMGARSLVPGLELASRRFQCALEQFRSKEAMEKQRCTNGINFGAVKSLTSLTPVSSYFDPSEIASTFSSELFYKNEHCNTAVNFRDTQINFLNTGTLVLLQEENKGRSLLFPPLRPKELCYAGEVERGVLLFRHCVSRDVELYFTIKDSQARESLLAMFPKNESKLLVGKASGLGIQMRAPQRAAPVKQFAPVKRTAPESKGTPVAPVKRATSTAAAGSFAAHLQKKACTLDPSPMKTASPTLLDSPSLSKRRVPAPAPAPAPAPTKTNIDGDSLARDVLRGIMDSQSNSSSPYLDSPTAAAYVMMMEPLDSPASPAKPAEQSIVKPIQPTRTKPALPALPTKQNPVKRHSMLAVEYSAPEEEFHRPAIQETFQRPLRLSTPVDVKSSHAETQEASQFDKPVLDQPMDLLDVSSESFSESSESESDASSVSSADFSVASPTSVRLKSMEDLSEATDSETESLSDYSESHSESSVSASSSDSSSESEEDSIEQLEEPEHDETDQPVESVLPVESATVESVTESEPITQTSTFNAERFSHYQDALTSKTKPKRRNSVFNMFGAIRRLGRKKSAGSFSSNSSTAERSISCSSSISTASASTISRDEMEILSHTNIARIIASKTQFYLQDAKCSLLNATGSWTKAEPIKLKWIFTPEHEKYVAGYRRSDGSVLLLVHFTSETEVAKSGAYDVQINGHDVSNEPIQALLRCSSATNMQKLLDVLGNEAGGVSQSTSEHSDLSFAATELTQTTVSTHETKVGYTFQVSLYEIVGERQFKNLDQASLKVFPGKDDLQMVLKNSRVSIDHMVAKKAFTIVDDRTVRMQSSTEYLLLFESKQMTEEFKDLL